MPAHDAVRVTVPKAGAAVAVIDREPGVPVASLLVVNVQPPSVQPALSGPLAFENVSSRLLTPPPAFCTVTITAAELPTLPAASKARAVSVCEPFGSAAVSIATEY